MSNDKIKSAIVSSIAQGEELLSVMFKKNIEITNYDARSQTLYWDSIAQGEEKKFLKNNRPIIVKAIKAVFKCEVQIRGTILKDYYDLKG